jgi:predicted transcriptional regulator
MRILKPSEVRALRSKLEMTQAQLAELAGVTQAYIAKIEGGTADPRISTLERVSRALEEATEETHFTAKQMMATPIISVGPKDKIKKAVQLMESRNISQLPVLDGRTQVGSISETTLIQKISAGEDLFRLTQCASDEIMEEPFPTVGKNADIDTIHHLLEHNPAVLVVDRAKPVGIITKADVLKLATLGSKFKKLKS